MTSGTVQRVLLLGPDDDARRALHLTLDRFGKEVAAVAGVDAAQRYLEQHAGYAVIAPGELAAQVAHALRGSGTPVIAVVRERDLDATMALLAAGVDDVLAEPLDELGLSLALRHVAKDIGKSAPRTAAETLVGDSPGIIEVRALVERIAPAKTTVLILGESGTGKELVARAIHDASPRRAAPFVAINCAAIPATLIESELFGHVKGAFTDASRDRVGLFENADGGTLFLDEIGELPLAVQTKLLRVLQEGEVRRIGATDPILVDVRVLAATLRDLPVEIAAGRFREDLFYRLNVVPIRIPPLRERRDDIGRLARFFVDRYALQYSRAGIELPDDVVDELSLLPWQGNVRELEHAIHRAVVMADGDTLDLASFPMIRGVSAPAPTFTDTPPASDELSIKKATRELEASLIARALGVTQGNRTNAAKLLEISHRALLYKMKEYGIS